MPRGKGKAEEEKRVWAWEGSGWPGQGKDARLPGWAHPRSQAGLTPDPSLQPSSAGNHHQNVNPTKPASWVGGRLLCTRDQPLHVL